jgi:hypothetical protein
MRLPSAQITADTSVTDINTPRLATATPICPSAARAPFNLGESVELIQFSTAGKPGVVLYPLTTADLDSAHDLIFEIRLESTLRWALPSDLPKSGGRTAPMRLDPALDRVALVELVFNCIQAALANRGRRQLPPTILRSFYKTEDGVWIPELYPPFFAY